MLYASETIIIHHSIAEGNFKTSRLNIMEPTFLPLFPQNCRETDAAVVQDFLRVSCYTGGVGVTGIMWLWSVFMAAVSAGHTLSSLGLNEYESRQKSPAEKVTGLSCLSLSAHLIPLFSCSLKRETVKCFLFEKVTVLTCVKPL